MARILSTPTTITITGGAGSSALAVAASSMSSGQFVPFVQPSFWTRTKDTREPNFTDDENDSCQDFRWTSPTEQGDATHGLGYTLLDWGSRVCYDPVGKQVMWACNGANPMGTNVRIYSWQYSKYSLYDEATDTWTQERGIKAVNDIADPDCIVHQLGGNAIDPVGRKFYRKKFRTAQYLVKDLTTGVWTILPSPSNEAYGNRGGSFAFIPTRGTSGMLWLSGTNQGTGLHNVWEIDPAVGGGSVLVDGALLGSQNTSNNYAAPCVYNPRAFGGAGGVLVGCTANYKLTVPPSGAPTIYSAGTPITAMSAPTGARVCADPVGDGWYHFVSGTVGNGKIYRTAGNAGSSTWQEVATLPLHLCNAPNLVLCSIDDYGVIWCLTSYLYQSVPVTWSGGQNGHQAWLWKP